MNHKVLPFLLPFLLLFSVSFVRRREGSKFIIIQGGIMFYFIHRVIWGNFIDVLPFKSLWNSLSLSFSPLYPFHLSIPFTSLSLSPLYPFHLSLSLLYLPPSLYLSFYLSFSLSPSLSLFSIIFFGVSNGRFHPCFWIIS